MAGRIPQSFIDDLLDRVDIVDVIDRRVKLKKTGKNFSARCPFHDEKSPSFSVNPEKQFYYCFGCGAGGNALGFIMDYENIDFPQAVENLATGVGLEVVREESRGQSGSPQGESPNKPLYELMERSAAFYKDALKQHPDRQPAIDYLKNRGLTGVVARDFGLGVAPPGWDNLRKFLGDGEGIEERAITAGMLVKNDKGRVYDRFRDRIVFPIRDRRGRVIAFGGRVLGDDKPKYLNSPESPIFHKGRELYGLYEARRANRKLERIIVVEGYMDVIALAQAGISYAVATLGTATSTEHLERIFRVVPEVIFCFDGDEAGRKAAERAMHNTLPTMADGRQARFLFLREGEDPDSLVRKDGTQVFLDLVQAAVPLEEFLFQSQAAGLDIGTMEGRASLSKRALPLIRILPEGVYRELMFQSLAQRTGLELASLMKLELPPPEPPPAEDAPRYEAGYDGSSDSGQGGDYDPGHDNGYFASMDDAPMPDDGSWGSADDDQGPRQRSPLDKAPGAHATLTQAAIALLLHKPAVAALADAHALSALSGREGDLLKAIIELLQKRPESSTGMLLGHWHGSSEGELLAELAGQERLIPTEGIEAQFQDIIRRLTSLPLRQRIVEEISGLKSRPYTQLTADDKARLPELLRALRDLDTRSGPTSQ
ncbi:DNA primase [Congregibacter brevis]|uniref:DNA primase n=1 Tax=Congregibacter brevis TaxID=3081201 RepID=A0ABZ0ICW7_9GAMM|nr:DNA primase [Congregibacter sp. IMCC45268]